MRGRSARLGHVLAVRKRICLVSLWAGGTCDSQARHPAGLATAALLNQPVGLVIDARNTTLYISQSANGFVVAVSLESRLLSLVAGAVGSNWCSSVGNSVTATSGRLNGDQSIASDGAGGFLTQDYYSHVIRRYSGPSATLTTIAGTGAAGYSGDGGPASSALLRNPIGVATDGAGGFFIADYGNNVVRRMTKSRWGFNMSTFAGANISGGYA